MPENLSLVADTSLPGRRVAAPIGRIVIAVSSVPASSRWW